MSKVWHIRPKSMTWLPETQDRRCTSVYNSRDGKKHQDRDKMLLGCLLCHKADTCEDQQTTKHLVTIYIFHLKQLAYSFNESKVIQFLYQLHSFWTPCTVQCTLAANQNKSNGTMKGTTISSFLFRVMLSVQMQMTMKILCTPSEDLNIF
jgi:hypothetical protein